jgi:predicted ATPase
MDRLTSIRLEGYKSFRDAEIQFGDVTVCIGANGVGKSNLVSFFHMLGFLSTGALQEYVGRNGGSSSLLYYGAQVTPRMLAEVRFEGNGARNCYFATLADASPDTLIFTDEHVTYGRTGFPQPQEVHLGAGHKESLLGQKANTSDKEGKTCIVLYNMLSRCKCYQFHDTSSAAKIRKSGYIEDASYLRSDAGNLAAYLLALKINHPDHYARIRDTVHLAFPSFGDFVLEPSPQDKNYILLNWRENTHQDYLFGPHQLSDGTLRFMALATLFLQPEGSLPSVIVLDEPELGLHPYAITVLAGMVSAAAKKCQVVLSTQSTRLVDEFDASQIVVFERDKESGTICNRQDAAKLSEWLRRYSISELWEKNIIGGRP